MSFKHFSNCSPRSKPGLWPSTQPMYLHQNFFWLTFSTIWQLQPLSKASGCKWSNMFKRKQASKGVFQWRALLSRRKYNWSIGPYHSYRIRKDHHKRFSNFLIFGCKDLRIPALFNDPYILPPEPLIHINLYHFHWSMDPFPGLCNCIASTVICNT